MISEAEIPNSLPDRLSHRQVLVVFSGLLLALLLAALDSTIVATALPTIVGELGGLERLAWVVTAYLLAQTIVTPLYGKLGDLFGRKIILQIGIGIFLLGSALCGLSRSMTELVLFRFIQGLGGGGLMVTAQAVVGDIVTPRERGRYQGIFGAVFGLASIAGPLIGGYFTTELNWRWIFYINLPLGIVALVVIGVTLPKVGKRAERTIDYAGAGLLAAALAATILMADLGGSVYPWRSPIVLGLGAFAAVSVLLFIAVERRAVEPILPLRLFANRTFAMATAIGLVVGLSLFGSVTYLPLFLQVVNGATPTASGLQLLPMMGGMLVTSITAGQLISRTGRYKVFPILGTATMAIGLFLLSRMNSATSVAEASLNMLVLGAGLGMVMQVLVIAVQNAVDYADLGVATSGATLFRLIGGSVGTAVFGALFAAGLDRHLADALPAQVSLAGEGVGRLSPQSLALLPPGVRAVFIEAFTASLSSVFLTAMAIAAVGFVLTWLIPERPLRETVAAVARDVGKETEEIFPMPTDSSSLIRLERALSLITSQERQRAYAAEVVRRAGIDLSPLAAWLLVRFERDPDVDLEPFAARFDIPQQRLDSALAELDREGLVQPISARGEHARHLTSKGDRTLHTLVDARKAYVAELLTEWTPEGRGRLNAALEEVARDFEADGVPS